MEVQGGLSEIIQTEIKDPRVLNVMITVMTVEMTPDLKYCKVYIDTLDSEGATASTLEGLKNATDYMRKKLAGHVDFRNVPEIRFALGQSIKYGIAMSKLIDSVTKGLKDRH